MNAPHVYCLTLPYSERHIRMQKHLSGFPCDFEFVFGVTDADPEFETALRTPYAKRLLDRNDELDIATLESIRRSYCCREGMLKMMRKVAADGFSWPLVLQDDVMLVDGWIGKYNDIIGKIPRGIDRVSVTYFGASEKPTTAFMGFGTTFCNETAMVCTPEFARRYVRDVEKYPVESDLALVDADGLNCVYSTTPLACLLCTPSRIANDA